MPDGGGHGQRCYEQSKAFLISKYQKRTLRPFRVEAILGGTLGKIAESTHKSPGHLGTATIPSSGPPLILRLYLAPDTTFHTRHLNTTHNRRLPCLGVEMQHWGRSWAT